MPLTANGLQRPSASELLEQVAAESRSNVSPGLDFGASSPLGKLTRILIGQVDKAYQVLERSLTGIDRDKATGVLLEAIGKLTGTPRGAAEYTEVDARCTLAVGTTLLAATHFASVDGNPDIRCTPKEDFTAPSSGVHLIRFRAEKTGPVEFAPDTLRVIATPVNGWVDVNNPNAAIPGQRLDDDARYRQRQQEELGASGSSAPACETAALERVPGVVAALVLENVNDAEDDNGLPPHSTEAIIWDNGGGATSAAIAQAVWDHGKSGGIRLWGQTSAVAVDENGDSQAVNFTRASARSVYLSYTIVAGDSFSEAAFKVEIARRANELFGMGATVVAAVLESLPFESSLNDGEGLGVEDRIAFTLGFTSSPAGTGNLAIGIREIARFDASRIAVTIPA
jgi:uncharacterized phage protein gp47/JayE